MICFSRGKIMIALSISGKKGNKIVLTYHATLSKARNTCSFIDSTFKKSQTANNRITSPSLLHLFSPHLLQISASFDVILIDNSKFVQGKIYFLGRGAKPFIIIELKESRHTPSVLTEIQR